MVRVDREADDCAVVAKLAAVLALLTDAVLLGAKSNNNSYFSSNASGASDGKPADRCDPDAVDDEGAGEAVDDVTPVVPR